MNRHRCAPIAAAALLLAACSSSPSTTATSTTTSATSTVVGPVSRIVTDEPYATSVPEGWRQPLLDVYAPAGATDLPLVILFHGNPTAIDKRGKTDVGYVLVDYAAIAEAIAQRGAVVVSANWGPTREPAELIPTVASAQTSTSEIGCAIAFAASHASDYGADPARLVVVGHSGGANAVSPAVLGTSAPFGGCATDESWSTSGLVLWEGDMLVEDPAVYEVGPDTPAALMAAFTPWGFLDNGYAGHVVFAVSDTTAKDTSFQRCDGTDFLTARDPTGWIQRVLDSQRGLHDGCVDVREESRVIGAALADHGVDVAMLDLIDSATSHYELGPADLQRFAAAVLEMVS